MRKLLPHSLVLLAAVSSVTMPAIAESEVPTLYGVKLYCAEGCSSGLYSVEAKEGAVPTLEWADGDMMGNAGAVYDGDKLYVTSYIDWYGTLFFTHLICDVEAKEYDYLFPELGVPDVGSAMTYDPSTGNTYSVCIDNSGEEVTFTLSTMDYATGKKSVVAHLERRLGALAATARGVLYGIGMDGCLYTVNKFDGTLTLVGDTGLRPENNQSAVIDYATGVMYWNAITPEATSLYKVDTATAEVTLITTFDPRFQFANLFIKQTALQDGAPSQPENINVKFEKGSLDGSVSFQMPTLDIEGNPLESNLNYEIKIEDNVMASGEASPGDKVKEPLTVNTTGRYQIFINVSNAAGEAQPVSESLWIGPDQPLKPENVLAEADEEGNVTLSWTLPEYGVNGGYVDADNVKYVLIRGPYGDLIDPAYSGTEYTEAYTEQGVNPLMYGVHAYIDEDNVTEMVMSNVLIMGSYHRVPFEEDLTDPFRTILLTYHDANADDCCWEYDYDFQSVKCQWSFEATSDDWMFSWPVWLEKEKWYSVSAFVKSEGKWNRETEELDPVFSGNLGIYLGQSATPEAMESNLLPPTPVSEIELRTLKTDGFRVPVSGAYHIGFHHTGPRSIYYMLFNGFSMDFSSGVETNFAEEHHTIFTVKDGTLNIWNPMGEDVRIVTLDGRVIYAGSASVANLTPAPGVYICTGASCSKKIRL